MPPHQTAATISVPAGRSEIRKTRLEEPTAAMVMQRIKNGLYGIIAMQLKPPPPWAWEHLRK